MTHVSKRWISFFLTALLLMTALSSCQNRRADLAERVTRDDSSTIDPARPVDAYAHMDEAELMAYYESTAHLYNSTGAASAFVNTPYYYIIADANLYGYQAYSKLTGQKVYLCQDSYCRHDDDACVFSGMGNHTIEEFAVHKDRIYYLMFFDDHNQFFKLYSTDLLFHDLRLEHEFEIMVDSQFEIVTNEEGDEQTKYLFQDSITNLCFYDNKVYYCSYTLTKNEKIIPTVYFLDLLTKENRIFMDDEQIRARLSLTGSILNWKNTEWASEDEKDVYYDLETQTFVTAYVPPTQPKVKLAEGYEALGSYVIIGDSVYTSLNHLTAPFSNDPFLEYYQFESPAGWRDSRYIFLKGGGEIFSVKQDGSDGGVPELQFEMTTDGIPDIIYSMTTDGKTIFVKYETYLDFRNGYNDITLDEDWYLGTQDTSKAYKYAIIDLTTGEIHKPQS